MPLINDELSVWEIAHRWNDLDPDTFRLRIPLVVKDAIRLMMQAIAAGRLKSNLSEEPAWQHADIPKDLFLETHREAFDACIRNTRYNKALLRSVEVQRARFKGWCEELASPLPTFWFSPSATAEKATAPGRSSGGADITSLSGAARKAAQKKHAPVNELKREFFAFWEQGKFRSYRQAAEKFYTGLDSNRKRLLVPTNAVRTLTDALSLHLRSKK